jgi:hypothetical protein
MTKTVTPKKDDFAELASDPIARMTPEEFAEFQRLADHAASAPNNERYKQELLAYSKRFGITHT